MLKHLKLHASYADIGGLSWYQVMPRHITSF